MKTYYNYKEYSKYIKEKYLFSEDKYETEFKNESPEKFLNYFEMMNVNPVYPKPIIMPFKKISDHKNNNNDDYYDKNINDIINTNGKKSKLKFDNSELIEITDKLNEKLNEIKKVISNVIKLKGQTEYNTKIRRYFHYEIKDKISEIIPKEKITTAWVKMFEILNAFPILNNDNNNGYNNENKDNSKDNEIRVFHLCEHPGAFIFATKYYVKNILQKKFTFKYQSLRPNPQNREIFKPDPKLLEKYPNALDYGPKNGDVTKKENIIY